MGPNFVGMAQLSERESQLPRLVTAGETMQKLTPMRLAILSYLANNEIETQKEMADALGVSPTTITTHLQLLSDLPRPLTIRKRKYDITYDGNEVVQLYTSMFEHFDGSFGVGELSDEEGRKKVEEYLSPLHETRSIAPFLVLYSIGEKISGGERGENFVAGPSVQLKRILDDVKDWQEERGKTASRKQVWRILQRFEEFDVIDSTGDRISLLDKGEEHTWLLEGVLDLLKEDSVDDSDTSSVVSQQVTGNRLTRNDTGGIDDSPARTQEGYRKEANRNRRKRESQKGEISDSALPAIVPAYRVVTDESRSSTVFPLTSTSVEEMADTIEHIREQYGNVQLELVRTNLSEMDEAVSADDSRLKQR